MFVAGVFVDKNGEFAEKIRLEVLFCLIFATDYKSFNYERYEKTTIFIDDDDGDAERSGS
jgi:hypothetical protein